MLNDIASAMQEQLQDGIAKGYWTLENLDQPSPGWVANTRVDKRTFPDGYQGIQHRNLLRDYHPEAVQAAPDPRDFAEPGSGIRSDHASLSVEGGISPLVSNGDNGTQPQPDSEGCNREGQAELGTTGEHAARGAGMPLDW